MILNDYVKYIEKGLRVFDYCLVEAKYYNGKVCKIGFRQYEDIVSRCDYFSNALGNDYKIDKISFYNE